MSKNNIEQTSSFTESPIKSRFYFALELVIILVLNFVFFYIARILDEILHFIPEEESEFYGPTIYFINLICMILSSIVGLIIAKIIISSSIGAKNQNKLEFLKEFGSLFRIKRNNAKYQLLYTVLLLFLVFIPLDFLLYLIPGTLDFTAESLQIDSSNSYITAPTFVIFLISSIIIHTTVGLREEIFFRGIGIKRGRKLVNKYSALIIMSVTFGMAHFTWLFSSTNIINDLLPAIIWAASAFLISCISSLFLIKTNYIWPLILTHIINNVISSISIWLYINSGIEILEISFIIYFPLLFVSIIIGIIFRKRVKSGVIDFYNIFRNYQYESEKNQYHKIFYIIFDISVGLIMWVFIIFLF